MSQFRLILASGSPQRKALMEQAGYTFEVQPPHESAECGICSNCGPAELVLDLAARKAHDVVSRLDSTPTPTLVIGCDTVAECEGMILGKPRDEDHARGMLEHLRGKRHQVHSGLCLWPLGGAPVTRLATTELEMDHLSDAAIEEYLDSGLWQGKAGAFGYQDRIGWLRILAGSESNVIGLPLELLGEMLAGLTSQDFQRSAALGFRN
jgi:septum formation protein